MKTFFSSPQEADYQNIYNKLDMILAELRHARTDHVLILSLLNKVTINSHLQKQVDEYYEEDMSEPPQNKSDLD